MNNLLNRMEKHGVSLRKFLLFFLLGFFATLGGGAYAAGTDAKIGFNSRLCSLPIDMGFEFKYFAGYFRYVGVDRSGSIYLKKSIDDFYGAYGDCGDAYKDANKINWQPKINVHLANWYERPASAHYTITGAAPNRLVTVQVTNAVTYYGSEQALTAQVILSESTGSIQIVYSNTPIPNSGAPSRPSLYENGVLRAEVLESDAGLIVPNAKFTFESNGGGGYAVTSAGSTEFIDISGLSRWGENYQSLVPKGKNENQVISNATTNTPAWSWYGFSGYQGYEIEVIKNGGAPEIFMSNGGYSHSFTYPGAAAYGDVFKARLRGVMNYTGERTGWTKYSDTIRYVEYTQAYAPIFEVSSQSDGVLVSYVVEHEASQFTFLELHAMDWSTETKESYRLELNGFNRISGSLKVPLNPGREYEFTLSGDTEFNGSLYTAPITYNFQGLTGPIPHAKFTPDPATGTAPLTVSLTNQSSGPIDSMAWDPVGPTYVYPNNGSYPISLTVANTYGVSRATQVIRVGPDVYGPSVSTLVNGEGVATQAEVGADFTLAIYATDPNGVAKVSAQTNMPLGTAIALVRDGDRYSAHVSIDNVPDGSYSITVSAVDTRGNTTSNQIGIVVKWPIPAAPTITSPLDGAVVNEPAVTVSGTAVAFGYVQVFVNGSPVGSPVKASGDGHFYTHLQLPTPGSYQITASARRGGAFGPPSQPNVLTYQLPKPSVVINSPPAGATVSGIVEIEAAAVDSSGIASVEIAVDGTSVGQMLQPPYVVRWDSATASNATHTIAVTATSGRGAVGSAQQSILVANAPPPPVTPPTPYTGVLDSVSPSSSYGEQRIVITGRAMDRATGVGVPNALLRLVLQVGGFQRRMSVATDLQGNFAYEFVPQVSDSGTYIVSVIHPAEIELKDQGRFHINRVAFDMAEYTLWAARGVPETFSVTAAASAGAGVRGLRWVIRPEDQASGSLPDGITLDTGSPIDLAPGTAAPMTIAFLAKAHAPIRGEIVLTAFSTDSGAAVRGQLRLIYSLVDAAPALFPVPTMVETGVKQGNSVSEVVTLSNRGLVPAVNVKARLVDGNGADTPKWAFLASAGDIGSIDVGAKVPLQLTFGPGNEVADGIHGFKLVIVADNDVGGEIPISVAVTQNGAGHVAFDVADIYTATLDANGKTIPGLQGARIKLQNEAVLGVTAEVTSDENGLALVKDLPPGVYLYRASAANHSDAAGRLRIKPGATVNQHVFLDYKAISIEFGVTETTIQDRYDLTLTATFNTQVPTALVVIEPLSVNLPGMQVGEEYTGEMVVSNYGLVRADNVVFRPPVADAFFKFEFFGQVPSSLDAKTRITVPYRVTALQARAQTQKAVSVADTRNSPISAFVRSLRKQSMDACATYLAVIDLGFSSKCANGDEREGSASAYFSQLYGACIGVGIGGGAGGGGGGSGGGGGGWGGGGGGAGPSPISLTGGCIPKCTSAKCAAGGGGPGGGGGGAGGGPGSGGPGGGPGGGGGSGGGPGGGGPGGPGGGGGGPGGDGPGGCGNGECPGSSGGGGGGGGGSEDPGGGSEPPRTEDDAPPDCASVGG